MSYGELIKPGTYSNTTVATGRAVDPSAAIYTAAIIRNRITDTWAKRTLTAGMKKACELIDEQRRNPPPPSPVSYDPSTR